MLDQLTDNTEQMLLEHYAKVADPSWPIIESTAQYQALPGAIKTECEIQHGINPAVSDLATNTQFMSQHRMSYLAAQDSIEHMRRLGIITTGVPIKKQTLREKKHIIQNFDHCLDRYNQWASLNPDIASIMDINTLEVSIDQERQLWAVGGPQLISKDS